MITKTQILDYITTLAFFGIASINTYQAQIMVSVPPQYATLTLIGFGILSQITADLRVKGVLNKGNDLIDQYQAQLLEANRKIDELQAQIQGAEPISEPIVNNEEDIGA